MDDKYLIIGWTLFILGFICLVASMTGCATPYTGMGEDQLWKTL